MHNSFLCLGVTGQIGSGKSTACQILKDLGAFLIDCDQKSKEILESSLFIQQQVIDLLGKKSYPRETPDYTYIAKKVFIDEPSKLPLLNQIIHPPLKKWIKQKKNQFQGNLIVIETALLFQSGFNELTDRILLIETSQSKQIERLQKNRNLNLAQIKSRLKFQPNNDLIRKKCLFQIQNNEDLDSLKLKIKSLWNSLLMD